MNPPEPTEPTGPAAGREWGSADDGPAADAGRDELADLGLSIPRRLGDFAIVREVGRGGMGIVFEAIEGSLGRRVALKVLPLVAMFDASQLDRFRQEAQVVALLSHPNILPIYSVGRDRGISFFAMPLVAGHDLAEIIHALARPRPLGSDPDLATVRPERRPKPAWASGDHPALAEVPDPAGLIALGLDPARGAEWHRAVAALGSQAARALEYSHAMGVLHRDIKPANLIVDATGHVWVTDFGLARFSEDSNLTRPGDLIGTIRYMSPERAAGRRELIDGRSDVYSLGMTLYETLARRPPFPGTDGESLLWKMAHEDPPRLRALNPAIPVDLETIVIRATARWPADRYPSAAALADDLDRFAADRPIGARRPSLARQFRRWAVRPGRIGEAGHALLWLGILLTAINAAALAGYLLGMVRPPDPGRLLLELAIAFVVFDAPPVWAGIRTIRGRRGGLVVGAAALLHLLALIAASSCGVSPVSYGGIAEHLRERWPYEILLAMLAGHALGRVALGIVAARANPDAPDPGGERGRWRGKK